MRDHPETAAGGARGTYLISKYFTERRIEWPALGAGPLATTGIFPVKAPKARFRKEHFGAEGYQPLTDQRIKLTTADLRFLNSIDGKTSVRDICSMLGASPGGNGTCDRDSIRTVVEGTIQRLVASHMIYLSAEPNTAGAVLIEEWEAGGGVRDRLSSPVNILWEPSLHCNLYCDFCYNSSGPRGDRGLRRREVAQALVYSGAFQVSIIGGEPMMLPDFFELTDYFEANGVGIDFVTNGWFIDDAAVRKLQDTQICQLMVSLDGMEKTHDKLRGREGSFCRAVRAIQLLSEAGFQVTVAPCVQRDNVDELGDLIDLAVAAGAFRVKARPMISEGRSVNIFNDRGLSLGEIERYQPVIRSKAQEYKGRASIVHRMPAHQLGVCACDYNPASPGIIARHSGTCGIGRNMCYVRSDGGVSPNSNLREVVLGNCLDEGFLSIWQDDRRWTVARPPNRAGYGVIRC